MTVDLSFMSFTEKNLLCVQGYLHKYLHICIFLGIRKYMLEHLEPGARISLRDSGVICNM